MEAPVREFQILVVIRLEAKLMGDTSVQMMEYRTLTLSLPRAARRQQ